MSIFRTFDDFYNAIMNKNLDLVKKNFSEYQYSISDFDYFLFRQACYSSNLEIVKWIYYTSDENIDIRCLNDMPFLLACAGNQFEIVKWLFEVDPSIIINNRNELGLIHACMHNNIDFVTWLHDKSDNINYSSLYNTFEYLCKHNFIEIPIYLASKCKDFYIEIDNNKIKNWKITSDYQRKLLDNNNYTVSNTKIDMCEICYDNKEYYVKYECNHMYCRDCSLDMKKCPMCLTEINNEKVSLLKQ